MNTIMIKDTVYKKLAILKKDKSFSEMLDALVEGSKAAKIDNLERFFGIMSAEEAADLQKSTAKIRKNFKARI